MLVLSRKVDETIIIGHGEIRITVVELRGDKVRIGIQAPKDVPVNRLEVFERLVAEAAQRMEQEDAAHDSGSDVSI